MKQRLLLLVCVLATALCAKAYTVTFDVKFGSFMTEKQSLFINIYSIQNEYEGAKYDETTGKYVLKNVEAGKYSFSARYPDMTDMRSGEYDIDIHEDITIPVDFTIYHKATFKASEGFELGDITILANKYDHYQLYNGKRHLYMPAGTYQWTGTILKTANGQEYRINKQKFTMEGADKNIILSINESDFRKVTFSVSDVNKQSVSTDEYQLEVWESIYENNIKTVSEDNGKNTCWVLPGTYDYAVSKHGYMDYRKKFKVTDSDLFVNVSYEGYKKLTIQATVSDEITHVNLYMKSTTDYHNSVSLYPTKDGNIYWAQCYCEPGITYEFTFEPCNNEKEMMWETGAVKITEDHTLSVDLSVPYYSVTFEVVDKKGNQVSDSNLELTVTDQNGESTNHFHIGEPVYFHAGNYQGHCYLHNKNTSSQNFSVSNNARKVTFVYDESQYCEVTYTSKFPASDEVKDYLLADIGINFGMNGDSYGDGEIREDGTGSVVLPKGTCNYATDTDLGMKPVRGTLTVTGSNDSFELDFSQYGLVYVKAMKDGESQDAIFYVEQDNQSIAVDDSESNDEEAYLLLPQGTYQVQALTLEGLQGKKEITVTAGGVSHETIELSNFTAGNYIVSFYIDSERGNGITTYNVTLEGYGSKTMDRDGIFNVSSTGKLTYTVTSPCYKTVKGVVDVTEENAVNGIIDVDVSMKIEINPTSIEKVTTNDNISVYPTVPEDYIYIRHNAENTDKWTARIISATGSTVYMNKQVLNGEEQIYVGNLPKGFYLLMLNNGEQRMTYKILKK